MILLKVFLVLVGAPFALIIGGVMWLWLGQKLLRCILGR